MRHVERFEMENALALVHIVVRDEVGLGVVDLTVEKNQVGELFEVRAPWMHEV